MYPNVQIGYSKPSTGGFPAIHRLLDPLYGQDDRLPRFRAAQLVDLTGVHLDAGATKDFIGLALDFQVEHAFQNQEKMNIGMAVGRNRSNTAR